MVSRYRNQGYNFTITSSTAYDQKWIRGRNTFENIDRLVDSIFTNFLSRPGVRQPIFTSYCDGQRVTCDASGEKVQQIQQQLNRIAQNYPAIPKLTVDGIYGSSTAEAVRVFQKVFGLPQSGITDYPTWYEISDVYVGVSRISEPG